MRSPRIVPGNRKKVRWREEESLKRSRIGPGEGQRPSIEMCMMRMRHDLRCQVAQGNQNKMAKLPRSRGSPVNEKGSIYLKSKIPRNLNFTEDHVASGPHLLS